MSEPQRVAAELSPAEVDLGFQFNLREHLQILRKRIWPIVGLTVAALALGGLYLVREPRVYRAASSVIIDTSTPRILGDVREVVDLGTTDYWASREFFETQYKVMTSREVLARVIEKHGLDRDVDFLGLAGIEDPVAREQALAASDPVGILGARVRIEPVKNSQIASVVVEDTSPARAAQLANAVVDAYLESNLARRLDGTRSASLWLAEQMVTLKTELESSELALYTFKEKQDILSTSLEDRQNITSQRLVALNDSLTKVMGQRVELESAISEVDRAEKERPGDALWALRLSKVSQSGMIPELRGEYVKQENEVAALSERYLEKHPQRSAAEERLARLKSQMLSEIDNVVSGLRSQHREVVTTEKRLRELIEGVKREAFEFNKKEIDYKKFRREQENNQRLYDLVLTRLKDAELTSLLKANNVRRLEIAQLPHDPIRPRRSLVMLFALAAGLLSGVGLAYAYEWLLDNSIKSEEDVERALQVPFIGMIPAVDRGGARRKDRKDDAGRDLFVFQNPKSPAAESCRAIRTNLLFMSADKPLRRLLVTSSGPQEGKTSTCINLGVTMAQNGTRVLLIDTDMRRPRLHRALGASNEVGLSSLLVGETTLEAAVKTTEVPNLWLLPCGPVPPNPAELLHTDRFKDLLRELSEKYDRVLLDSPPLLPVADALVLSSAVDGVLLVTRFRKTAKVIASRALRALRDVNAPILGVVMNDVNLESREYDYYYYRRYGYEYAENTERSPTKS